MKQNHHYRWTILGLWLVFLVPFISASLLYYHRDKFEFKLCHHGELLTPPIESKKINLAQENFLGKWQIVYLKPKICNEECHDKIKILNNVKIALGKDQDRIVSYPFSNSDNTTLSGRFPFKEDSVVIIDPKGWLILKYSPEIYNAKAILEDLRRLLRYSRV